MTYKSALAGLPFGGGKSVIIGDPKVLKTEALLEAFGRCVARMGGKYICAEDIGMTPSDMAVISRITPYVTGLPGKSGDTSPLTGYGVYRALLAAADRKLGRKLESVAILGFGNVGRNLAGHLVKDNVRIYVADINQGDVRQAVAQFGATAVTTEEIFGLDVDAWHPARSARCSIAGPFRSSMHASFAAAQTTSWQTWLWMADCSGTGVCCSFPTTSRTLAVSSAGPQKSQGVRSRIHCEWSRTSTTRA